jgi:hypothetical protein
MDDPRSRDGDRLAIAVGVAAAGSAICLATYFAVGGPFGTLNDIGNAATGVLSGVLAWRLRERIPGRSGAAAVGAAMIGAALTVVGSALVVSGTTGFFLAGLVSSVGFAGVGAWLLVLSRSAAADAWPARLRTTGLAAGALMVMGVVALPGLILGLDDMSSAPAWAWIGFLGWLGTFVAYPIWAIWTGLSGRRTAGRALAAGASVAE